MVTRLRFAALAAVIVNLLGCVFFYRTTDYTYGEQPAETLRRFQALKVLSQAIGADIKQSVYLDRVYINYYESVAIMPGWLSRRDTVMCRYAETPAPQVDTSWMWDLVFPIPTDEFPRVRCAGMADPVLIDVKISQPKSFVDAWAALARPAVPGPVNPDLSSAGLPEELRSFKVRAEAAVRDKNYWEAADLYDQALTQESGWAQGHYNLALVCAELKVFDCAIDEMKKYQKLVPSPENARQIQDKIYLWQAEIRT